MTKRSKSPQIYFSSDFHFNHYNENSKRGIITFERFKFKTIQEHDKYIQNLIMNWSQCWAPGSTFWFLGDWGDISYLWLINLLREASCKCFMVMGNHDLLSNKEEFEKYFDKVYEYPVFLSQKLVVSHYPVAVYEDSVNVCGHLHGSKLRDPNHINANIYINNYQPVSDKQISAIFSKIPKFTRRFLYEPWAADYKFTQNKEDVVMDLNGYIDLSASRLLQKINKEYRNNQGNVEYNPYTGGLNG